MQKFHLDVRFLLIKRLGGIRFYCPNFAVWSDNKLSKCGKEEIFQRHHASMDIDIVPVNFSMNHLECTSYVVHVYSFIIEICICFASKQYQMHLCIARIQSIQCNRNAHKHIWLWVKYQWEIDARYIQNSPFEYWFMQNELWHGLKSHIKNAFGYELSAKFLFFLA